MHAMLEQIFPENMTTEDLDRLLQDRKYGRIIGHMKNVFTKYVHDKDYRNRACIQLDSYLRIGDRVIMCMDRESHGWESKEVPDGTYGTVVEFSRFIRVTGIDELNFGGRYSGAFLYRNGPALVKWDGKENTRCISAVNLVFADSALRDIRKEEWSTGKREERESVIRLCDLPQTAYMPGDKVNIEWSSSDAVTGTIGRISYGYATEITAEMPLSVVQTIAMAPDEIIYNVTLDSGGSAGIRENHITGLIARGNFWKKANGEPLFFPTVAEEVSFWMQCGKTEPVKNSETNHYMFTNAQGIDALCNGQADFYDGIFTYPLATCRNSQSLYKFIDMPELAERIRMLSIELLKRAR